MSSLARSAVILYDCDLRVTQLNGVARRFEGARDWIGRPLHQCLASLGGTADPPLDRQDLLEHASRGSAFPVRVGDVIWRAEVGPLSDDELPPDIDTSTERGALLWETSVLPGSPVGVLVLREAGKAEDYRDLALDRVDFLAALSHDLRTPLNAMLGWLHLLSMPQRGPDLAARAIAGLRQAIEQQQHLLVDWADRARAGHAEAQQFTSDTPFGTEGVSLDSPDLFADVDGSSAAHADYDRRARKMSRRHRLVQQPPRAVNGLARRQANGQTSGVPAVDGADGSGLSGVFVLAVDDRPEMLDVLTQVLAADGASIETTTSADDALARYPDWAASGGERLLVSDLAMPGRDGFSLIREIRALERHRRMPRLPAVALSAHGLPDVRRRAIENGYDLFVDKPVDPRVLLGRLHSLLDR